MMPAQIYEAVMDEITDFTDRWRSPPVSVIGRIKATLRFSKYPSTPTTACSWKS